MNDDAYQDETPWPALSETVAIEVLVHGAQSRAQLAKSMGLSAATLTRLVRPLIDAGVLVEAGAVRTPGRGRSSLPLDVVPERHRFVGVKLTTESAYAVVTDLRAEILERQVKPLASLDVADVVDTVADIVAGFQAVDEVPVTAVGVTVGGQVAGGEVVADSPFMHWHEVPFRHLLAERIRAAVHLENDVVGLTQAQLWFGYGRDQPNFALLTVGAGIGYGLVLNGSMVRTGIAPVSHFPIDPFGPLCPLGHRGCLTGYLTSGSMTSAVSAGHGRAVGYDEVLQMAEDGDPVARRVVDEGARALGRAAAAISTLTGVQRIILSGEGVHLAEVAWPLVQQGLLHHAVEASMHSELVVRPMDFHEWARGAAAVAIRAEYPRSGAVRRSGSD